MRSCRVCGTIVDGHFEELGYCSERCWLTDLLQPRLVLTSQPIQRQTLIPESDIHDIDDRDKSISRTRPDNHENFPNSPAAEEGHQENHFSLLDYRPIVDVGASSAANTDAELFTSNLGEVEDNQRRVSRGLEEAVRENKDSYDEEWIPRNHMVDRSRGKHDTKPENKKNKTKKHNKKRSRRGHGQANGTQKDALASETPPKELKKTDRKKETVRSQYDPSRPFYVQAVVPYHNGGTPDNALLFQKADDYLIITGFAYTEGIYHQREIVASLHRLPALRAAYTGGSRVSVMLKVTGRCRVEPSQRRHYIGFKVMDFNGKETFLHVHTRIKEYRLPGDLWMAEEKVKFEGKPLRSNLNTGDFVVIKGAMWSLCGSGAGSAFCLKVQSAESFVSIPNQFITDEQVRMQILLSLLELLRHANGPPGLTVDEGLPSTKA